MADDERAQPVRRRQQVARAAAAAPRGRLPPCLAEGGAGLDLARLTTAAVSILEDVGIACQLPAALAERCTKAGLLATATSVKFPAERGRELLALAPRRFTHVAREPARSLEVSAALSTFGAAMTAAHVWEGAIRRPLRTDDAQRFASIATHMPALGYGASALHLAARDVSAAARLAGLIQSSTSPLLAVAGSSIAAHDLVAAVGGHGDCRLMIAAPVAACLTFDEPLLEALMATGTGAQGLIIAPTILIGANAPATREGALVRFAAEAMAGVALAQALTPGQPVAIGGTFADVSMRNGLPLVGTADAVATMGGAIALSRHWQLPFYAFGPATSSKGFDALGSAETARWLTAAWHLGANAIIGAIGAVDLDDGVSIDTLVVDAELAATLSWPAATQSDDPAAELRRAGAGATFLGSDATRRLARMPPGIGLSGNQLFESWEAAGSLTLDHHISAVLTRIEGHVPPLTGDAFAAVAALDRRPMQLTDLASSLYSRAMRDAFGFGG